MKPPNFLPVAACAALLCAAISPRIARADDFNDRTIVTFSSPVQVPGATLQPGTYVFKVLESAADRVVVQISDEREKHVFATTIATPNYNMTPQARREDPLSPTVGKTLFTFTETQEGQPQQIRTWYYPAQGYGFEFVYPKTEVEH